MNLSSLDFFSNLSYDWVIICAIAVIAAFDSLRSGNGRACAASLAVPIALLVYNTLPNAAFLSGILSAFDAPTMQALLFATLYAASYLLANRMLGIHGGSSQPFPALISGLAFTVLFTLMWISVPALGALWEMSPDVRGIFGLPYQFWWIVGAFTALAYARA